MGEHYVDIVGVTGSIPVTPTIFFANASIVESWYWLDRLNLLLNAAF